MRFLRIALLLTLATACAHGHRAQDELAAVVRSGIAHLGAMGRIQLTPGAQLTGTAREAVERVRKAGTLTASDQSAFGVRIEELSVDHDRARISATRWSPSDCGTSFALLLEKRRGHWAVVSNRVIGECESAT